MLVVLTIIALIGVIMLWEIRRLIKDVPAKLIDLLFKPFHKELKELRTEIKAIKNDLDKSNIQ